MGGRETGGLANMLAAHMEIDNPAHRRIVQNFWDRRGLAEKPGLKAVDLFGAVGDGRIKALWIMSTKSVRQHARRKMVAAAIERCPFVVVSTSFATRYAATRNMFLLPSRLGAKKTAR